jgi:HPt (histidine-containing phosphotransfer) domain-containing protein
MDAIESGQSPMRPAHTLKGMAWNIGALRLGNLAKQLETAQAAEARRLAADLRTLRQRSIDALVASTVAQVEASS